MLEEKNTVTNIFYKTIWMISAALNSGVAKSFQCRDSFYTYMSKSILEDERERDRFEFWGKRKLHMCAR